LFDNNDLNNLLSKLINDNPDERLNLNKIII